MKKILLIALLATTMIFNAQAYKNKLIEQNTESLLFKNRVYSPMDKMHGTLDAFDLLARQKKIHQHVTGITTGTDQAGKALRVGAATTSKIRLDSMVLRFAADSLNMKQEYTTYDANGNNTLYIYYSWNSTSNQWVGSSKIESTFDANGNIILSTSYFWDSSTNQWVGFDKNEVTYNANGNNILSTSYSWNSASNQWVGSNKDESTYDINGNIILRTGYSWNSTTNQWVCTGKLESVYDGNGNIILNTSYSWNNTSNQWVGAGKSEFAYDGNGNNTLETDYNWDANNNQWVGRLKLEYTYDTNSKKTLETHYSWDTNNNQWVGRDKYESTYDGNNTLYIDYNWDSTSNQWVGRDKAEITYDMYGNIIFDTLYDWNKSTNQWFASSKDEVTYDYSYLTKDIVPRSFFNQFINPPTLVNNYTFDGISWSFNASEAFYYSAISNTAIPELANNKLKVYTTATEIIVEGTSVGETVVLYTLNGVTVQAQKSIGTSIVLTVKNKGVYMLKTANKTFKVVL